MQPWLSRGALAWNLQELHSRALPGRLLEVQVRAQPQLAAPSVLQGQSGALQLTHGCWALCNLGGDESRAG